MEVENFVIPVKIEGAHKRTAKATLSIPKETLQEILQSLEEENSPTPEGEYLTINELCKLLKIGRMTIWRHSKKGILKPRKIGNRVLFARADIDEYLKKGGNHAEC